MYFTLPYVSARLDKFHGEELMFVEITKVTKLLCP